MTSAGETASNQPWTVKRLLQWTSTYLSNANVEHGRLCAEILLADVLKRNRIELYTHFDFCPAPEQLAEFRGRVKRCAAHEPVQYLTGRAHFMNLTLTVTPAVLIPRPETELLVEQALAYIDGVLDAEEIAILDLCTGSGCIAAAIASRANEARIVASDIDEAALAVARLNIAELGLQDRVTLIQSDLFAGLKGLGPFALIVSNPPYIERAELARLDPNVRDYEPRRALDGGPDGLEFYRIIIAQAEPLLAPGGRIKLEVGHTQADAVIRLMEQSGYLAGIKTVKDHLGHTRVVKALKLLPE